MSGIRKLLPKHVGKRFTCQIVCKPLSGRIQYFDGNYFLCHKDPGFIGNSCQDKLGYPYSWCVHDGSEREMCEKYNINDMVIMDSDDWDNPSN